MNELINFLRFDLFYNVLGQPGDKLSIVISVPPPQGKPSARVSWIYQLITPPQIQEGEPSTVYSI